MFKINKTEQNLKFCCLQILKVPDKKKKKKKRPVLETDIKWLQKIDFTCNIKSQKYNF